jgi:ketopantoate hydroxymethyltransferase
MGDRVAIARLGRPHGVRGDITAHADGPTLGTLEAGDAVTVRVDGTDRELVLTFRRGDVPKAVIAFAGIDTREDGLNRITYLAIKKYVDEVRGRVFPSEEYMYPIKPEELAAVKTSGYWKVSV